MIYGSVCSGIEAATVAWHPLGWRPTFFSEIEKFPSAVLAHHYPHVPNLGDMTKHKEWDHEPIDILVGGTPCQSFSVAGLRKGMADPRGNLALVFLALADRTRPRWLVWENVPGVLSSNSGRDFGSFLGALGELGYGWAYRVIDAQYCRVDGFGRAVPQRRRRVFVVGYLGDWRRAAAVLFERESMSGNPPPRREAGKGVALTISARPTGGGGLGTDFDCDGGLIADGYVPDIMAQALTSKIAKGSSGPAGDEHHHLAAHALRAEGFDASEDGTGRSGSHANAGGHAAIAIQERAISENPNAGPDGKGFNTDGAAYTLESRPHSQAVAYGLTTEQTPKFSEDCALTLTKQSPTGGGQPQAVAFAENSRAELRLCGGDGQVSSQLTTGGGKPGQGRAAVAFDMRGRDDGAQMEGPHDTANIRASSGESSRSYVAQPWAVRRLTTRECERLQGFPDDYTLIEVRGKPAADGPRYKALGNSMAVNVMRWIGRRIEIVEALP